MSDEGRGVVDGRRFLDMKKSDAMRELRITSDATYERAYRDVEQAVKASEANRSGQASVVVKKSGQEVSDA